MDSRSAYRTTICFTLLKKTTKKTHCFQFPSLHLCSTAARCTQQVSVSLPVSTRTLLRFHPSRLEAALQTNSIWLIWPSTDNPQSSALSLRPSIRPSMEAERSDKETSSSFARPRFESHHFASSVESSTWGLRSSRRDHFRQRGTTNPEYSLRGSLAGGLT